MRGWIGTTDYDWYDFLSQQKEIQEVNFWQPSGGRPFKTLAPGEPFLFKLKKPHNAIAGFGYFARHSILPAWLAWEAFGLTNGAPSYEVMRRRVEKYRSAEKRDPAGQYQVGCILVASPVFFPESEWIRQPADWHPNIVQGSTYDLAAGEGLRIWQECLARVVAQPVVPREATGARAAEEQERYGAPVLVLPRLGQGIFRVGVMDAYGRACAVTGEHSLPVLEAAHIRPYSDGGTHEVTNGVLLRSDIHRLFDRGYVTISPDLKFQVSDRLRQDFDNGRVYYSMRDNPIRLPKANLERPRTELLEWHNQHVFLGR